MKICGYLLTLLLVLPLSMSAQEREKSSHCTGTGCADTNTLPPASSEQIAAHPWLVDTQLPELVGKYSKELEQVLYREQKSLSSHWGPEFRSGANQLSSVDEDTAYKWELISHKGADEYRVKRAKDGAEIRIVMLNTKWVIYSGDDYTKLIAEGGIDAPLMRSNP
jgi:hypothetical protein